MQNLRTSDDFRQLHELQQQLAAQDIESVLCDLGLEARRHRYALLLPHAADSARAWQLMRQLLPEAFRVAS